MSYSTDLSNVPTKLYAGGYTTQVDNIETVLFDSNGPGIQGIALLTPVDGAINVSVTPSFTWDSETEYDGYKVLIADNAEYTNAREAYVTAKNYNEVTALLNDTNYFWKVEGGAITDRPAIVPDSGFTGMTVWGATTDPAPIYYPNDIYPQSGSTPDGVAPMVKNSANDLADFIQQSSGKTRPTVQGVPSDFNFPQRCIKIGFFDPALTEREEYKIVCADEGPLEISGKDVFDPNNPTFFSVRGTNPSENEQNWMTQAGTYNAVMAFVRDHIGAVFAFPGSRGTVIPNKSELKVSVQSVNRTPSTMVRNHLRLSSPGYVHNWGTSREINKRRGIYYSMYMPIGHMTANIYDTYHPDGDPGGDISNLKYFALQPDGTRSGYPFGRLAKTEIGDPDFDDFFIDNYVIARLSNQPLQEVFPTGQNDSFNRGRSRDPRALSMDYPDRGIGDHITGTLNTIVDSNKNWTTDEHAGKDVIIKEGTNVGITKTIISNTTDTLVVDSDYPLPIDNTSYYEVQENDAEIYPRYDYENTQVSDYYLTDRQTQFTKRVLENLRARGYNDLYLGNSGYGVTHPAPKRETPDEKIITSLVSNEITDPFSLGLNGQTNRAITDDWLSKGFKVNLRPNLGSGIGHNSGTYLTHVHEIGNRLKTIIPNGVVGLVTDTFWEHHGTQWVLYHVISELLWDHTKDVDEIMDNAYQTLFPNSWSNIKAFYERSETVVENNYTIGTSFSRIPEIWTEQALNEMQGHLDDAFALVSQGTDEYDRLEYVQGAHTWVQDWVQSCRYFQEYNSLGVVIEEDNKADGANAIEDDTNASTGWTTENAAPDIVVQQSETNGSANAFRLNAVVPGNGISKLYNRTEKLPDLGTETGTATGGDSSTLIDTSKSMTVNEHIGRVLRITGGLNDGQERVITANTSDTFTVEPIFLNPTDNTCTYEVVDMYLLSFDVKHTGNGGRAFIKTEIGSTGVQRNSVTVANTETEWNTYQIVGYGGDHVQIRDGNDQERSFDIYVDNFKIQTANPVNKQSIADLWVSHNESAIAKVEDPKWNNFPPISTRAYTNGNLPFPNSSDYVPPTEGVI